MSSIILTKSSTIGWAFRDNLQYGSALLSSNLSGIIYARGTRRPSFIQFSLSLKLL
jgi:hypothetical protein